MLYASLVLALALPLENSSSCNEHGQLPSPLNVRNRAGQRSSVPRSDGGISSGLARLCSWLVITTWGGHGQRNRRLLAVGGGR